MVVAVLVGAGCLLALAAIFVAWEFVILAAIWIPFVAIGVISTKARWLRWRPGFRLSQQPGATVRDDFLREGMSNVGYDDDTEERSYRQS